MKLTGIGILKWNGDDTPIFLGMAVDVMSFGYFQRGRCRRTADGFPLPPRRLHAACVYALS